MKKVIYLFLFFVIAGSCFSQTAKSQRNQLIFGGIGSGFNKNDRLFYILNMRYEYRTPMLNEKVGVGLGYNFVKSNITNDKELAIGPILNYHFVKINSKLDPYLGIGYVYSQKNRMGEQKTQNFQLKYQYGIRYHLSKHLGLSFELSNYRHSGGWLASDNKKRESGIFPTFGILIK